MMPIIFSWPSDILITAPASQDQTFEINQPLTDSPLRACLPSDSSIHTVPFHQAPFPLNLITQIPPMAWIGSSLSLALTPQPNANPSPITHKKKVKDLAEELSRVIGENRKLTEMLAAMNENYRVLQAQFAELMMMRRSITFVTKRKSPDQSSSSGDEESIVFKKPRESGCGTRKPSYKVLVRADKSDTTLIVKDGYQWRKYGQKVTRDNPSPRAYFKCSFAPMCQVKKKVQRSAEDQTFLVATYDGEHNHLPPSEIEASSQRSSSNLGPVTTNSSSSPSNPKVTLDLIRPVEETRLNRPGSGAVDGQNTPVFQQFIVEQMASSFSNDPGFKAAVAAAISGRVMMNKNNVMVGSGYKS